MQIPKPNGQNRVQNHEITASENATIGKSPPARESPAEVDHTTDARVADLRAQFKEQQIRPEVVAAAKEQLASGHFVSRVSAEHTAREIIGIIGHF